MTVAQGRVLIYTTFGVAITGLAGLVRLYGELDDAPLLLQLTLAGVGVGWAVLVVVDVVLHTWRGEGLPCPQCGHKRHHRSFHLASPCPKCGE